MQKKRYLVPFLIFFTLLVAIILRSVFIEDIEYKGDEKYTFHAVMESRSNPIPSTGMLSSIGLPNAGASVWIFIALGRIFNAHTPLELARAVQILNIFALFLLFFFAWKFVPKEERNSWFWGGAIAAVNPLAVLFHRKIWAQCLFPAFSMLFIMSWWKRHESKGAFFWGFLSSFLWQIQMSGLFFSGGFFIWAFLFDRKNVRWRSFAAGVVLGMLPAVPWIIEISQKTFVLDRPPMGLLEILKFRFFRAWLTESMGVRLSYSIGEQFDNFLAYPQIAGHPSYLVSILVAVVHIVTGIVFLKALYDLFKRGINLKWIFFGRGKTNELSPTQFTITAGLWGMGLLMVIGRVWIFRHYMIVLFPLCFVWFASLTMRHFKDRFKILLGTFVVAELLVSICFLGFIHKNCGAPGEDYGTAYRCQVSPDSQVDQKNTAELPDN